MNKIKQQFFLTPLLDELNIDYTNIEVYTQAFTHSSMDLISKCIKNYERLEFLGDSILGSIITSIIYKEFPEFDEGKLTKLRSHLVDKKNLSRMALKLSFDKYVRFGPSYKGMNVSISVYEDIFEAFIGAIFLDHDYTYTYEFVKRLFYNQIRCFDKNNLTDYKSKIQELFQAEKHVQLKYKETKRIGPSNDLTFFVSLYYFETKLGSGKGKSLKEAEQNAARDALNKMAKKEK